MSIEVDLGKYWDDFIARQVASGRYVSKEEVIREALRMLAR